MPKSTIFLPGFYSCSTTKSIFCRKTIISKGSKFQQQQQKKTNKAKQSKTKQNHIKDLAIKEYVLGC